MKNKRSHIARIFSILLLCVFSIALIPWSSLHHHVEEQDYCTKDGKACMHKTHVGNERHSCLICSAHFVKDYHKSSTTFLVRLQSKVITRNYTLLNTSYTSLIRASLRGPPESV